MHERHTFKQQQISFRRQQKISLFLFIIFLFIFRFFLYDCSHQNVDIDFKKYERTFQRIKKGCLPTNPTTIAEIIAAYEKDSIITSYGQTLHVDKTYRFYDGVFESPDHSFCVFSSKATIELITEKMPIAERHILMDATFRVVPIGPFYQLLILYIRKNKHVSVATKRTYYLKRVLCQSFDLFVSPPFLFLFACFF